MSAQSVPRITPEEYLAIDRAAEFKSEYFDGKMYAMSGGTLAHSALAGRMLTELNIALAGKGCRVFNSDARIRATRSTFVYPDVSVVCGRPEIQDNDILLNPVVIVKVLSESTERYDRGLKFARYRRMESLQEYALVAQSDPRVEVFARQPDGSWSMREYEGLQAVVKLPSIGVEISLQGLYQDIDLGAAAASI